MKIHVADHAKSRLITPQFISDYTAEIEQAYNDASVLLEFGSKHINFFIQPSRHVIKETGLNAFTINSEFVSLNFDEDMTLGEKVIIGNVRSMIFHEMSHAARFNLSIWHATAIDMSIFEGLATVFEREHVGSEPLWGQYDADVIHEWFAELNALDDGVLDNEYRFKHHDGRRWISYKVGTYIVDEAMRLSGKSIIECTQMECSAILALADLD